MNYEKWLIKEYKYWGIYLHKNQYYLGRVYIWAKRKDALDFFDMTKEEQEEYFKIGKELKKALRKLFKPDLYNYATLANISPHLHTHFIPRYKKLRKFEGVVFNDKRWGKNYAPYDYNFKISEDILIKIKNEMKKSLSKI